MLPKVFQQSALELSGKGSMLSYKQKQRIRFGEFERQAKEKDMQFRKLSQSTYEDLCWKNLRLGKDKPLYAIDNPFSLFTDDQLAWNLNKFTEKESLIHGPNVKLMQGIQTPFVYIGSAFTAFGFHIEDGDLYSINYNHYGKPKLWYIVPKEHGSKLSKLINSIAVHEGCLNFVRHKRVMIAPSVLQQEGIHFARMVQNAGEYVVVFDGSHHGGFNFGFNMAEAINFANENWLKAFEKYEICSCPYV